MIPDRTNNELDVFAQLKPILGEKIDKLYVAYIAGNPLQKMRILRDLQLLSIKLQRKRIGNRRIYLEPPRREVIGGGDYEIGKVVFPGSPPYPFTLYRHDLLRHVLALGMSGSGKTTLILNLVEQLQADDIPWLALDWKGSFRVLMRAPGGEDVLVLTVGSAVAPLRINMLLPPPRVSLVAWLENIADTICTAYLLMEGARSKLISVFLDANRHHGDRATLRDALGLLRQDLAQVPKSSRNYGWMESTERALVQLTTGPFGDCLNERDHPMLVGELLQMKVTVELRGLGQGQGTTVSIFFLQSTLLTRQHQQGRKEVLRHVTIVDEAQNVFRKEATWEKLTLPSRTIREVREYGECVIAGTQQIDVSESLLANTSTKFIMRTNGKWELDYFSKSFQVNPLDFTVIPNGQGITVIPAPFYKPFLFSFPENKRKNIEVTDDEVRERYAAWREDKPTTRSEDTTPLVLGTKELALLRDIASKPLDMITQHYDNLGWNAKIENGIKDNLVRHKIIELIEVKRGRSTMKFAQFTKDGLQLISQHDIKAPSMGPASIEHEYWRNELRTTCEKKGYTVTPEYALGDNRYVDLQAARTDRTLLIEIETGKSDIPSNIKKCQGKGTLILFFTSRTALEQAQPIPLHVITITPETISTFNDLLD